MMVAIIFSPTLHYIPPCGPFIIPGPEFYQAKAIMNILAVRVNIRIILNFVACQDNIYFNRKSYLT